MDYYNQQLFPGDEEDPLESLMDEERELLEAIDASEGEEGAAKDGEDAAAKDGEDVAAEDGEDAAAKDGEDVAVENGEDAE